MNTESEKKFTERRMKKDREKANIKADPQCRMFRKLDRGWECMECGQTSFDPYSSSVICQRGKNVFSD